MNNILTRIRTIRQYFDAVSDWLKNVIDSTRIDRWGPPFFTFLSVPLFIFSLPRVDVSHMNDLGMVSVMPLSMLAGLMLLVVGFGLSLHRADLNTRMLLFQIIILICMLYGMTTLTGARPRFAVAWRHVGIIDYIVRHGSVNPNIDAYFNWPGFFVLAAFMSESAGLNSSITFAPWSPVVFNLLYLGPLLLILSSATRNKHIIWLSVFFFYMANWIGQDYLSPQGLHYFTYLVILAILLKWFKTTITKPYVPGPRWQRFGILSRTANRVFNWLTYPDLIQTPSKPYQRAGLVIIVALLYAAIVPSHQLSPFALLLSVSVLVIFNRCSLRGLPFVMAIIVATWISYMTTAYMRGHLQGMLEDFGQLGSSIDASVTDRLTGSAQHLLITRIRLLMTVGVWGLAFMGGLWRLRRGYKDTTWALLAGAPFIIQGMQSYGGEILLRIYLFSLPFMAFFAAAFFYTSPINRISWRKTFLIYVYATIIMLGFLFSRYGNERTDYKTIEEIDAIDFAYGVAEPNSYFVSFTPNVSWRFRAYEIHYYKTAPAPAVAHGDIPAIMDLLHARETPDTYLVLTRSQEAFAGMNYSVTAEQWDQMEQDLLDTGELKIIFKNRDAEIYTFIENEVNTQVEVEHQSLWASKSPLLAVLALYFLMVIPGLAVVRLLKLNDPLSEWVLAVALSFALDTLISNGLLYAGLWSPRWGMIILVLFTLGALLLPRLVPIATKARRRRLPLAEPAPTPAFSSGGAD